MTPLRWLSLVFRLAAIVLVVACPWLPARKRPDEARSVVYVVDRSRSMGEEGLNAANEILRGAWRRSPSGVKLGAVAFDAEAELLAPVGAEAAPVVREGMRAGSSDLAAGIRLAAAALPSNGHRSLVLVTDAQPTRGHAVDEVRKVAASGIRVDVVSIGGGEHPEPVLAGLRPRATHVAERQPVAVDVDVRGSRGFVLHWTRDGMKMPPRVEYIPHAEKVGTYTLVDAEPPPGIHVYEVRVVPIGGSRDAIQEASAAITAVSVEGKGYAVVFCSSGTPPVLETALREIGIEPRSLPIERAGDVAAYSGADLVVLADARVSGAESDDGGLTRASQTALVEWVQQGGGLLVTGGVFGFAPEYANTPIARAIPVEIEDRGHVEDPPVALAIMLDRSGSMAAMVGSHTKIELAIEASLAAADVLRPTDHVAIASVDTETHWDVPLGPQQRLADLRRHVREVTAGGGGIYVYTALKDAYAALERTKQPIRHVILFSDTADSEEQAEGCSYGICTTGKTAEALAKEARTRGITTTVVGIGEETASDTPFLRRVAAAAGGRFYLTAEGADLRRIFLSETRVLAQSNLRERKTAVTPGGTHPALEGVDASKLPELAGYVETGRRAGADTALVLAGAGGRPMLATWRYGLGKAGAITTDLGEGWGGAWAASSEAAKVLRQTLRFLVRQNDARRADATVRVRDRLVEVDLELAPDAPESASPRAIDVFAIDRAGASKKVAMQIEPRGPGRWTARGRSSGEPIVIVRARDARGALMAEGVGQEDRTPEVVGAGVDERLARELANVGDGRLGPTLEETFAPTRRPAPVLEAVWPWALVLAAVLVVLDLVLRRLGAPSARASDRGPRTIAELARVA